MNRDQEKYLMKRTIRRTTQITIETHEVRTIRRDQSRTAEDRPHESGWDESAVKLLNEHKNTGILEQTGENEGVII